MEDAQKKEETKNRIYDYLKQGLHKKDSAVLAGISEATLYRWIEEDESFESRVEASILEYKHTLIKNINICAEKDGRLALEVLRRRFPEIDAKKDEEEEQGRSAKQVADLLQKILNLPDGKEQSTETTML
ncbi:MAG: hypothetical protein Q8P10_02385 [bacterium]|nr:hypothetical protein [bacterium]